MRVAFAAHTHEFGVLEHRQVMRRRGLLEADELGEFLDGALAFASERKQPQPAFVGERLQSGGEQAYS